jgi:NitT/TauT family transport system substrate-binding protein
LNFFQVLFVPPFGGGMEVIMKRLKLLVVFALCITVLAACTGKGTGKTENNATGTTTPAPTTAPTQTAPAEATAAPTTAPTEAPAEKIDIKIAALKGPTAIGMVKLMDDAAAGTTANNYTFTTAGTADEISAGLVKGDFDIAAVPCNLASVLYNKTKGQIKLAGINTLGVLYIVETGNSIQKVEDLKGKTIYSTGIGTTPQFTLNYLLTSYGIDPEKDVTIEYKTEATEVAAMLSKADNAIAMLPQPYVTTVMMNNDKVRVALDIAKEWEAVSKDESSVVTGVVVVRSDFLEKNKEAFDDFMAEYKTSAAFVNENIDEASALVEKYDIFKAAVIKKAIPYCGITLIQGEDMKKKVGGYLTALYNQNPKAVGGALPAEDFYYLP